MRYYRTGGKVWTSYRSAVTSAAQRYNRYNGASGPIEYVDLPDTAWKPVDKQDERRRYQLSNLAATVTWDDPASAVDVLTTLMKEARERLQASKARLSEEERSEVDRLLARLANAA